MRNGWMIWSALAVVGFLAPQANAGQFGYTFDCDVAALGEDGTVYEALVSRHLVPNTIDVLYFVQIIVPLTDVNVEEELFLATDNFINWADDSLIVNPTFVADTDTQNITFHMEGAQTGKSVSGHGTFRVMDRTYTFVAWPKTSLQ